MAVYGLTLLSFCMFVGVFIGDLIGKAVGVSSNVGGVGFAMLLLILISNWVYANKEEGFSEKAEAGIAFWSMMYIPIVVAMAARQNVVAALQGGPAALTAGVVATVISYLLIPIISKLGAKSSK